MVANVSDTRKEDSDNGEDPDPLLEDDAVVPNKPIMVSVGTQTPAQWQTSTPVETDDDEESDEDPVLEDPLDTSWHPDQVSDDDDEEDECEEPCDPNPRCDFKTNSVGLLLIFHFWVIEICCTVNDRFPLSVAVPRTNVLSAKMS